MSRKTWEVHARELRDGEHVIVEVDAASGEKREREMSADERKDFEAFVDEQARLDREGSHRVQ